MKAYFIDGPLDGQTKEIPNDSKIWEASKVEYSEQLKEISRERITYHQVHFRVRALEVVIFLPTIHARSILVAEIIIEKLLSKYFKDVNDV